MKYKLLIPILTAMAGSGCTTNRPSSTAIHETVTDAINYADSVNQGIIPEDTLKGSPIRTTIRTIAGCQIQIVYGSPGVKGRIIWGGLVPYDRVWVTGAHSATSIDVSSELYLAGHSLPKGKYALFTIPGKEKWTIIINRNYQQHLTDKYAEKDDVLRFDITPESGAIPVQRLTYSINDLNGSVGEIMIAWEKVVLRIPVEVR